MDQRRFEDIVRMLAAPRPRRGALRLLVAISVGFVPAPRSTAAVAKRRKRKPLRFNAFGCINVGKPCRGRDEVCCSGICEERRPRQGKKDRSRCVAHDTGGCTPEQDQCAGVGIVCGANGRCFRTTGNGSFCGNPFGVSCISCRKDTDCDPASFGPGAACVVCPECFTTSCAPAA